MAVGHRRFDLFPHLNKGVTLSNEHDELVATIAAALNNPRHSAISDPRRGHYTVTLRTGDLEQAAMFERTLQALGLNPQTNYKRDDSGKPTYAFVALYGQPDQQHLLELVKDRLSLDAHEQLERLVLARGPIPDEIKKRIRDASTIWGWSVDTIASKMNQAGIIAGMGGKHWTARKIRAALASD